MHWIDLVGEKSIFRKFHENDAKTLGLSHYRENGVRSTLHSLAMKNDAIDTRKHERNMHDDHECVDEKSKFSKILKNFEMKN